MRRLSHYFTKSVIFAVYKNHKFMARPHRITLSQLSERIEGNPHLMEGMKFYSEEGLVLSLGMQRAIKSLLRPNSPYLIDDYRFGIVVRGSLYGRANLMEYRVRPGTLVYVTPGSFLEPLDISDDLLIMGMGVSREVAHLSNGNNMPAAFNGRVKHGIHLLSEADSELVQSMYGMFWNLLQTGSIGKGTKYSFIAAIMNHINDICLADGESEPIGNKSADYIFNNFIRLVNLNAAKERHLAFYADKLCITERYLGAVVRQTSGITAKEWIDRAVITFAKVMLRNGKSQVNQIADELNFPNPSFFCKYFKRMAGCTPQEFREGQTGSGTSVRRHV